MCLQLLQMQIWKSIIYWVCVYFTRTLYSNDELCLMPMISILHIKKTFNKRFINKEGMTSSM